MNIIYVLLILVLIICSIQYEQFSQQMIYFDDYIYGYEIRCKKLCKKFQQMLDESKEHHHSTRHYKKIVGIQFRSVLHYNLFIDSLFNRTTFDDRICFKYSYSPHEISNGSYQISVKNNKISINKNSFTNKCFFDKKI